MEATLYTLEQVAERMGVSKVHVSNLKRMASLRLGRHFKYLANRQIRYTEAGVEALEAERERRTNPLRRMSAYK